MIHSAQAKHLFLSSLLPERYPKFFTELSTLVKAIGKSISLIENTKDIWAKDYMPVQVSKDDFVCFKYDPNYLTGKWEKLKTDNRLVSQNLGYNVRFSEINLDGGNVVACGKRAIMTDKIYNENKTKYPDKEELRNAIKDTLQLEDLVVIQRMEGDTIGHSDGYVRFLDQNTVILEKYVGDEDKNYYQKMRRALRNHDLNIFDLPCYSAEDKNEQGIYSAEGCYVNYLQMKDLIIVPQFGKYPTMDQLAVQKIRKWFPDTTVLGIDALALAKDGGGVLNCISWEVMD